METKHSKGKWVFQTTHNKIEIFSFVNGMAEVDILNSCLMNGEDISIHEQISNAKLIAAAPDLLENLIIAQRALIKMGANKDNSMMRFIDDTIKKATE